MKRKYLVAGAGTLTAVAVGLGVLFAGSGSTKADEGSKSEKQVEAETQQPVPSLTGMTNISSVGVSSVIDTMDTENEQMNELTGKVSYYGAGFAEAIDGYNNYLYENETITDEQLAAANKQMDIATGIVPEGSILAGYTNLGVSNVSSYLNIRKDAGTSYKVVGKMPGSCACEILEEKDGWYKVKSGSVTGYVSSEYILTGYEANVKAKETMKKMLMVNCDTLNVREEPSTSCSVSTKVSNGEFLEIIADESDGWYRININGLEGYVNAEYVEVVYSLPTAVEIKEIVPAATTNTKKGGSSATYTNLNPEVSQTAVDLINYAYQFLGCPYVYGGNSLTNGTDCSGFVKLIFGNYGYSLPRSSGAYVNVGTQVPLDQIKAGDILVYKYGSRVGHVAIYIGNGQIIHAATPSQGICIGNAYFVSPYMAVRVIP